MATATKVLNLQRLERKIQRLPAVAKTMIRQAMAAQADEIVRMMKSLVPVLKEPDSRRKAGALRDSIGWTWGQAPRGSLAVSTLKGKGVGGGLTITIYAGTRDKSLGIADAYWARWVEFGTANMQAQPYFYVSWRANKKASVRKVRSAVRKSAKAVASGG